MSLQMTTAQESLLLLTANCEYVQLGKCVVVAVYRLYITPRFYIIALRLCITYGLREQIDSCIHSHSKILLSVHLSTQPRWTTFTCIIGSVGEMFFMICLLRNNHCLVIYINSHPSSQHNREPNCRFQLLTSTNVQQLKTCKLLSVSALKLPN